MLTKQSQNYIGGDTAQKKIKVRWGWGHIPIKVICRGGGTHHIPIGII